MSVSVRLRRVRREDGARVLTWRNSPEVARFMYADHLIGEEEHAGWLDAALTRADRRHWIVELDARAVGLASLTGLDRQDRRADLALYVAEPAARGQGVGRAIDLALLRHAFEALGLRKVWCEALADNAAGLAVHERLGFAREALLREHVVKNGSPRDVVGLGLLAHAWPAIRSRHAARLRDIRLEDDAGQFS